VMAADSSFCPAGQGLDAAGNGGVRCCVRPHPQRALLPPPPCSVRCRCRRCFCCCACRAALSVHGACARLLLLLLLCCCCCCRRRLPCCAAAAAGLLLTGRAAPHEPGGAQGCRWERAGLVQHQLKLHRAQQHL
jgi:hypothetical protein